jgi:hypothetical protein
MWDPTFLKDHKKYTHDKKGLRYSSLYEEEEDKACILYTFHSMSTNSNLNKEFITTMYKKHMHIIIVLL